MGKLQDAINQAFGLGSSKSDADRGGQDYSKEEAGWLNKWLSKPTKSGQAKGDRYDTREKPYDFYKRQAAEQARWERQQGEGRDDGPRDGKLW